MNQSKRLKDGVLLTTIFIVLLLVSFYIQFLSIFGIVLSPIPFVIFAYRYNWKPALLMFLAAIILSTLLATIFSLPFVLVAGIGGIMIGAAMHRGASAYETWAQGTVGFVIGLLAIYLISQVIFQVDFAHEFDLIMAESMEQSKVFLEQIGMGNQSADQLQLVEQQLSALKILLPVGLAVVALLLAFVSQWASYKLINRIEQKKLHFPAFRQLRFPTAIVWIYFVAIIVSLFNPEHNGIVFVAIQNIIMLAGIFMIIQGYSFIFYFFHLKNKSKIIPIVSLVLSLLLAPYILPLIRILGIIDIGFGLRGKLSQK